MSSHIGAGYGSEFHLMRYLARYRNWLNHRIEEKADGRVIEWLDFVPGKSEEYSTRVPCKPMLPDHELVGLEFLKDEYPAVVEQWRSFWPQRGNQQNWDAVAKIEISGIEHWLLVEAKANIQEIKSDCGAKSESSIKTIDKALRKACELFGLQPRGDLKKRYYQYANRLAALCFLREHDIPARLLFIYFIGDKNPEKKIICPESEKEWKECANALKAQYDWLGMDIEKEKAIGIIDLFLNVVPSTE